VHVRIRESVGREWVRFFYVNPNSTLTTIVQLMEMVNRAKLTINKTANPAQAIFTDAAGASVKFFIQKDLPDELQANIRDAIQAEDGIVDAKVPIKGYILIQPGTAEGERLQACWANADRPERYFVPYTWIDASREAGKMIPQIFVKDGAPIKMRIHSSIANLNSREVIATQILHAGGDPSAMDDDAAIILADPETDVYGEIVRHYQNDRLKTIESHLWVKKCIDRGIMFHSGTGYKNPGGRRPGDERTAFTEDDEANLCTWIAAVIPYKESGGRTGNKIYQELVSRANEPGYEWVGRHTWQSWRERYKKNATRLDQHVAALVNLGQTGPMGKAQFGYFRISEGKQKSVRKRRRKSDKGEEPSNEASSSQYSGTAPATPQQNSELTQQPPPTPDDPEWKIKEGHAPAPTWAKRDTTTGESLQKRHKTADGFIHQYAPQPTQPTGQQVEQALTDIANEFHFLFAEVREFYDKSGDLESTRGRFAKMRMLINTMP